MNNIFLLALEVLFAFGMLVFCSKAFGRAGLIAWVGVATILANLLAVKTVDICGMAVSMGAGWFGSVFLATDIISELYDKVDAKKAVLFGLFSNLLFVVASQITLAYVPSAVDYAHDYMAGLFELNLRLSIASAVMYALANLADISIYNALRDRMHGHMWIRNNVATVLTNCSENFGLLFLAFWGIYDAKTIMTMALCTSAVEMVVAFCDTPFLYIATRKRGAK